MIVPFEWLRVQGGGRIEDLQLILDLYARFAAGELGTRTPYAETLRKEGLSEEAVKARLVRLFVAHIQPLGEIEVPVRLTALGEYEVIDGYHRSARCRYEGRAGVPVRVEEVSLLWAQLVASLEALYPERTRHLYQAIEHPYFADWAVDRSSLRYGLMLAALSARGIAPGLHLDVGSCTGRIVREFARRGWRSYGVDRDARVVAIAEHLGLIFGVRATFSATDQIESRLGSGWGYGAVTCLSTFHRMMAAGNAPEVAALYRRILDRTRVFFVDDCSLEDVSVRTGHFDWSKFGEWLRDIAGATHTAEAIGTTEGRTIFACFRVGS